MEPAITIVRGSKEEKYRDLLPQIKALLDGEDDLAAALGNVTAALKLIFQDHSWVGFYFLKNIDRSNSQLILGPFQGKPACTRIKVGQGVCGKSVELKQTIIVPDVSKFPGHIYCDRDTKSEIVVPLLRGNEVLGVIDIDSSRLDAFDEVDRKFLEEIAAQAVSSF
ncbi:MAG: GAF domain-containing protein [Bacteroidota bacterium]